jgi:uncharacterized protein
MRRIRLAALALAGMLFAALPAAGAEPVYPDLTGRVVDQADIIPADVEASLTAKLADLEAKTGDQFVVVTLASLQGYEIADFGYQLGRHWAIGQKGKNNGPCSSSRRPSTTCASRSATAWKARLRMR